QRTMPQESVSFLSVSKALEARFAASIATLRQTVSEKLALAVSGGGDSIALLQLLHQTASNNERDRTVVYTVDHGLREEAKAEARMVGTLCDEYGIAQRTMHWTPDQTRRTQAAARHGRFELLADAARKDGVGLVLTGHTKDDDAETFLIRARAGSSWYGLAGMQELGLLPVWPEGRGLKIGHPLLQTPRSELRDYLQARDVQWIDDPSNDNPQFERVRVRQLLKQSPDLMERIARIQSKLKRLRHADDRRLAQWFEHSVEVFDDGTVLIDADWPKGELGARALSWLCQIASGRDVPPRGDELRRLSDRLQDIGVFPGATLGGARLWKRRGALWMGRDPGDIDLAESTENPLWDNRFEVARPLQIGGSVMELQPNARIGVPQADGMRLAAKSLARERLASLCFVLKKASIADLTSNS
ncbi:MAG: tRNA lysidine(34) synthetase TilS, partial [Pseudomonadota bacterium]